MNKPITYILTLAIMLLLHVSASAQSRIVEDFKPVCDTLSKAIEKRTTVRNELKLKNVMRRGDILDFYFTV